MFALRLTSTPNFKSSSVAITCQEVVRQYTNQHEKWRNFESTLADQNLLEMRELGQRNAPLCDGCLRLKEDAVEYVTSTLSSTDVRFSGYLETIFSGGANHYCKVNYTDDFITGFLYKKDKIHDHIPIPEPTRVSSFIQFPVPMPFHALTFTLTYVGLCLKCDKLWYCDTLQSANWTNRMKWVIPTSARKWYSFGVTEGPGSGAHGIQFSTKGYKNFIVLCDTWGRQEQWTRAIDEAILGLASQAARRIDPANAMAIDIDNEVDTDDFDLSYIRVAAEKGGDHGPAIQQAVKSESRARATGSKKEAENASIRRRSNTISMPFRDLERLHQELADHEDATEKKNEGGRDQKHGRSTTSEQSSLTEKVVPGTRAAKDDAMKADPLARSPVRSSISSSASPPRHNGLSPNPQRNLDLKKFQPDTRKFSEILNNLKMASPPRVNAEGSVHQVPPPPPPASASAKLPTLLTSKDSSPAIITRARNPAGPTAASGTADDSFDRPSGRKKGAFNFASGSVAAAQQLSQDRASALEPLGMRHVVSTPNLTQLS